MLQTVQAQVKAVDGVSFDVQRGEILGIVGESGCGKSTLARLIQRLIEPDAGEIRFAGQNTLSTSAAVFKAFCRQVQMVFQDPDLAMCLVRTALLREGRRLTEAHASVVSAMGVPARVLPMSDQPVATFVRHGGRLRPFQEYMIVAGAAAPVEGVALQGIERARPTDEVLAALASCDLIVIGPSNPVISIGPILALPGDAGGGGGRARAGGGGEPVRGRAVAEGTDGALLRLGGDRSRRRRDRAGLRGADRRAGGRRAGRGSAVPGHGHADG